MSSIEGSVVFITGAGRGIGRALAVAFNRSGAQVAAQDMTPVNLDATMQSMRSKGVKALDLVGDPSKKMQVQSMIETAREALGEVDILINNACVAPSVSLLEMDEWDWDRTLGVNLKGYFLLIQSIGRLMCDRQAGTIINMVAPPTRFDERQMHPAYEISAAAICQLTGQAAREFGRRGVGVAAVRVERELQNVGDGEADAWWQSDPETVAGAVLGLCERGAQDLRGKIYKLARDGSLS